MMFGSFLTPHLVRTVKRRGVEVIGVFAPEDGSHAKRRLLECGISDIIEADAPPEEMLGKVESALIHRTPAPPEDAPAPTVFSVGVTGAVAGVGMTEVSAELAFALSRRVNAVLVDLDQTWPSVAQRLGLPLHPNIRTVIDGVLHESHGIPSLFDIEGLRVVGGRADRRRGAPIGKAEVLSILEWLASDSDVVVADLGPFSLAPPGLMREFSEVVIVGSPDPVGVARMSAVVEELRAAAKSMVGVVNGLRKGFHRSEILSELSRAHPELPVLTLPHDRGVTDAAWDGRRAARGRFAKSLEGMADLIDRALS